MPIDDLLRKVILTNKIYPQVIISLSKMKIFSEKSFKDPNYYFWQSTKYLLDNKFQLALNECYLGLKYDPDNFQLSFNIPILQFVLKHFDKSLSVLFI